MVKRKEVKKALYLLKKYNQTPIEVIEYMTDKLLNQNTNDVNKDKNNNENKYNYFVMTNEMVNKISQNFLSKCNNSNIISKSGFRLFRNIFKDVTNNVLEIPYDIFEKADSMIIGNNTLEAVKEIKTYTKYDLRNSKLIVDCLRIIHGKISVSYF